MRHSLPYVAVLSAETTLQKVAVVLFFSLLTSCSGLFKISCKLNRGLASLSRPKWIFMHRILSHKMLLLSNN